MKTKKFQVVMLPTDKKSNLYIIGKELYNYEWKIEREPLNCSNQHLYITSDEEIKEGDWCYYKNGSLEGIVQIKNGVFPKAMIRKKIIASTDKSLITNIKPSGLNQPSFNIKYNEFGHFGGEDKEFNRILLPSIPESFIKTYIRAYNEGNVIKEVELETEWEGHRDDYSKPHYADKIKTNSSNEVIIHSSKDSYTKEEVLALCKSAYIRGIGMYGTRIKDLKDTPEEGVFERWIEDNL